MRTSKKHLGDAQILEEVSPGVLGGGGAVKETFGRCPNIGREVSGLFFWGEWRLLCLHDCAGYRVCDKVLGLFLCDVAMLVMEREPAGLPGSYLSGVYGPHLM